MKKQVNGLVRGTVRSLLTTSLITGGVMLAGATPAGAATTGSITGGVLTVIGDNLNNSISISRTAAGVIQVNGGAVVVAGGTPTVANISLISVFGLGGNDVITLIETNGALPRANLFGGEGNDVLTGGSGADMLFGQGGNDTLLGKLGSDLLFGGLDNDVLTGGDADDQAFGEGGDDRMIWNPGDDTDLNEGGGGTDTIEVNGGNGAEQFTTTANGTRVRFDRITPAPFSLDIGTSEILTVNANGGDDSFNTSGNLAALIRIIVDGGTGNDTLSGSNGADTLLGGDGNDVVIGRQGNDTAFLGAGDDTFQWNPGDGNDTVEGQAGIDRMLFNGSNASERIDVSANGGRVRLFRDVAAVMMDTNDVETFDVKTFFGSDTITANDLSGTDLTRIDANVGGADGQADNVIVNATQGDDVVVVNGANGTATVTGLAAQVSVGGAEAPNDRLTVNTLAGNDIVDASDLAATALQLTENGGDGADVLIGGSGNDTITGGAGDDVLLGGPGADFLNGGDGDDIEIQGASFTKAAAAAERSWLAGHATVAGGKTVLHLGSRAVVLPHAQLSQLK